MRIFVLIFDVNETLLDLENMRTSIGKVLEGNEYLTPLCGSQPCYITLWYHCYG